METSCAKPERAPPAAAGRRPARGRTPSAPGKRHLTRKPKEPARLVHTMDAEDLQDELTRMTAQAWLEARMANYRLDGQTREQAAMKAYKDFAEEYPALSAD